MITLDPSAIHSSKAREREEIGGIKKKFIASIDGQDYIVKTGAMNYEIFSLIIAEKIGQSLGINMAHYELCKIGDRIGIMTPIFLSEGEQLIASDKIRSAAQQIYDGNGINSDLREHTIDNIVEAASVYDTSINVDEIKRELVKRWLFYVLIMESDTNPTNISFIADGKSPLRLSPDYDNSTMARSNEDVGGLYGQILRGASIYTLTDPIKTELRPFKTDSDNLMNNFYTFMQTHASEYGDLIEQIGDLDIDSIIDEVGKNIDDTGESLFQYYRWLKIALKARQADMMGALKRSKQQ